MEGIKRNKRDKKRGSETQREVLQKPRRKSVKRDKKYLAVQMPQDSPEEHLRLDIPW